MRRGFAFLLFFLLLIVCQPSAVLRTVQVSRTLSSTPEPTVMLNPTLSLEEVREQALQAA